MLIQVIGEKLKLMMIRKLLLSQMMSLKSNTSRKVSKVVAFKKMKTYHRQIQKNQMVKNRRKINPKIQKLKNQLRKEMTRNRRKISLRIRRNRKVKRENLKMRRKRKKERIRILKKKKKIKKRTKKLVKRQKEPTKRKDITGYGTKKSSILNKRKTNHRKRKIRATRRMKRN